MRLITVCAVLLSALYLSSLHAPLGAESGKAEDGFDSEELLIERHTKMYTREVARAVESSLTFLSRGQNEDGSWGQQFQTANTAMCGLAFLTSGVTTSRGKHGKALRKAIDYFINAQSKSGYYSDDASRMHGHGYATMFLAEAYGQCNVGRGDQNKKFLEKLKESIDKAIALMIDSQAPHGGFPYNPGNNNGGDHEGSITVTCVEALRAARNAGIYVPKESIDKAVDYMKKTYNGGSFDYRLNQPTGKSFALSSAGACVLIATGDLSREVLTMINECIDYMRGFMPGRASPVGGHQPWGGFHYYSMLYGSQAFHYRGGKEWESWYGGVKSVLLTTAKRSAEGLVYWEGGGGYDEAGGNPYFSSSMAILALQMPNQLLPIFQK